MSGLHNESVPAYRAAAALDPGSLEAHLGLGTSLRMCSLYEKAVLAYRHAIHLEPDNLEANKGLGLALDGAGRHAEGREFHNRAAGMRRDREWRYNGR